MFSIFKISKKKSSNQKPLSNYSTSVKSTKKKAKVFKIGTISQNIEVKRKDYITRKAIDVILLLRVCYF